MITHLQTPTYRVVSASDIGMVHAAIAVAKGRNVSELEYVNLDNPNRSAHVVKWERWNGRQIEIKKPSLERWPVITKLKQDKNTKCQIN